MMLVCSAACLALPGWLIWYWLNFSEQLPALQAQIPSVLLSMEFISTTQLILAAAITISASMLGVYALWQLRSLFALFSQGVVFSSETTRRLNLFGIALLASTLLRPIVTTILSVVLTWGNPPGQRSVVVSLGSSDFMLLVFATTFLVITWVFREGQRLSQENAEFV